MKSAVNLLFWGYLFVLLSSGFSIEIIPLPLAYFIIATGCTRLGKRYPAGKKAWAFSLVLIFISFPTIFVNIHEQAHILWTIYSVLLMTAQLILAYFVFNLLKEMITGHGTSSLVKRLQYTFTAYMISHLFLFTTFIPNMADERMSLISSLLFIPLIMDVSFLLLMRAVRRDVTETIIEKPA